MRARGGVLPSLRSERGLTALAAGAAFAVFAVAVARGWLSPLDRQAVEHIGPGSAVDRSHPLAWTIGPAVAVAGLLLLMERVRRLEAARLVALLVAVRLAARWLIPLGLGVGLAAAAGQLAGRPDAFLGSGALSAALLVGLAWGLWRHPWSRVAAIAWGLAACLAMLVLGVQWPSDLLAGALLGTALVAGGPLGRGVPWARRARRR